MRDAIKLAVVTIPIVLLGFAIAYLLNKWAVRYQLPPAPLLTLARQPKAPLEPHRFTGRPCLSPLRPRLLILGVRVPLAALHLWIKKLPLTICAPRLVAQASRGSSTSWQCSL